jgi:hypothetical protein
MAEQPFKVRKLNINGSYILAGDFDPSENGLYAPVPSLYFKLGSTLIYTKTGNLDTDWIPLENTTITDLINNIFTATGEPTGFPIGEDGEVDKTSSTISFNTGNRTFTIAPTTTSYYFFVKGNKYTKTTSSTVTIDAGANTYYIYFDKNILIKDFTYGNYLNYDLIKKSICALYRIKRAIQFYLIRECDPIFSEKLNKLHEYIYKKVKAINSTEILSEIEIYYKEASSENEKLKFSLILKEERKDNDTSVPSKEEDQVFQSIEDMIEIFEIKICELGINREDIELPYTIKLDEMSNAFKLKSICKQLKSICKQLYI